MNKQSLNKLSLFLTGMEQRLIDNWEFFKGITAVFQVRNQGISCKSVAGRK